MTLQVTRVAAQTAHADPVKDRKRQGGRKRNAGSAARLRRPRRPSTERKGVDATRGARLPYPSPHRPQGPAKASEVRPPPPPTDVTRRGARGPEGTADGRAFQRIRPAGARRGQQPRRGPATRPPGQAQEVLHRGPPAGTQPRIPVHPRGQLASLAEPRGSLPRRGRTPDARVSPHGLAACKPHAGPSVVLAPTRVEAANPLELKRPTLNDEGVNGNGGG